MKFTWLIPTLDSLLYNEKNGHLNLVLKELKVISHFYESRGSV